MKSAILALTLAVFAFFTTGCNNTGSETTNNSQPFGSPAAAGPTATPDEFASARTNFQKNCAACHGAKADGGRVTIEGVRLKVPSLKEGHALHHTDDEFVKQITEGDDEMPAFKDKLKPEEINDLVRFIRREFQGK